MDRKSQIEPTRRVLSAISIAAAGVWAVLGPVLGTGEGWTWNINYFALSVLPAGCAVLGGLVMMSSRRRLPIRCGGLLALTGGLWFMVGPMSYLLWPSGGLGTGPALGGSVWLAQWIGFFFATGAVITLLSSYALGFMAPLPDEAFEHARAGTREPLPPEHARRRPSVRQPAQRRERPHAEPDRRRAQHRS